MKTKCMFKRIQLMVTRIYQLPVTFIALSHLKTYKFMHTIIKNIFTGIALPVGKVLKALATLNTLDRFPD